MKAKELEVGMECYYHQSNKWLEYNNTMGQRAVIVDPRPGYWMLDRPSGEWSRSAVSAGQQVLVDIYPRKYSDPSGQQETPRRLAVPTMALRGPWEQTNQRHLAAIAERQEAEAVERQAQQARMDRCEQAMHLLEQLGVPATVDGHSWAKRASLVLSDTAAQQLTAAIMRLTAAAGEAPQ